MPVCNVRVEAHVPDVPDGLVVDTHREGRVGKDAAINIEFKLESSVTTVQK